jgi:uncharacterized membrane protein YjjP (DUF1212 family)
MKVRQSLEVRRYSYWLRSIAIANLVAAAVCVLVSTWLIAYSGKTFGAWVVIVIGYLPYHVARRYIRAANETRLYANRLERQEIVKWNQRHTK